MRFFRNIFNRPYFKGQRRLGKGVRFGRDIVFNCNRVEIGDDCYFGDGVRVDADSFVIGNRGAVYPGCFFPGPGIITIGDDFWLGKDATVDCQGGITIGNHVGIGGGSQVWTHIKFGDVRRGCRFHENYPVVIEDDVWLVGHVLCCAKHLGARSMAMLGSVIVKDMEPDRTYAGVPARDMTDVFGPQYGAGK